MKKIPCKVRLHGIRKETLISFDSISEAKRWLNRCWFRPYTIVRLNQEQQREKEKEEKMYSREEVIKLCEDAFDEGSFRDMDFDKWIEENL